MGWEAKKKQMLLQKKFEADNAKDEGSEKKGSNDDAADSKKPEKEEKWGRRRDSGSGSRRDNGEKEADLDSRKEKKQKKEKKDKKEKKEKKGEVKKSEGSFFEEDSLVVE